jgi:hypothetical protein
MVRRIANRNPSKVASIRYRVPFSTPVCHLCVNHVLNAVDGYRVFQPFEGGYTFFLLQAFSWLFLGIMLQVFLFVSVRFRHNLTPLADPSCVLYSLACSNA